MLRGQSLLRILSASTDVETEHSGIFENMTSFSAILNQDLEQGKLMAAVNCRKLRSKKHEF